VGPAGAEAKANKGALFGAASDTLSDLADSRLGEPDQQTHLGVLAVLHTWANNLTFHPHVHCIVTGGGLSTPPAGQPPWAASRPRFLLPVQVLGPLFRGKLLDQLRQRWSAGELPDPPGHRFDLAAQDAWAKRWVVHVDPPAGRDPAALTKYLARYVRGVAISDRRILAIDDTTVTIQTRRGRQRLDGIEFVRRFAQHVLPRRFHSVRYFVLYAPNQVHRRLVEAWRTLGSPEPRDDDHVQPRFVRREPTCPACGGPLRTEPLDDVPSHRPTTLPRPREPP